MIDTNRTVWHQWLRHAESHPRREAIIHWVTGKAPVRWSFAELLDTAKRVAYLLRQNGVRSGQVCAIMLKHHPQFYPLYMGVAALGAIPAVLAYPNPRLHPEKFRQGIEGMSRRSGLDWLLTTRDLLPMIDPVVQDAKSTIKGVILPLEENLKVLTTKDLITDHPFGAGDPFLLQHSSGTTGLQKPVLLSNRAVLDHAKNYGDAIGWTAEDKVVSWLPLYHDMGLIAAFHLPLIFGIPTIQIDPFDWVVAPELLIEAIDQEKATLLWLPNFAFNLMVDRVRDDEIRPDAMRSLRLVISAGEPIRKNSIDRFVEKYARFGLDPKCISTLYGMAETTMGVTQTRAGEEPAALKVSVSDLAKGIVTLADASETGRTLVSSGTLIQGCEVKVIDDQQNALPAGQVGEIAIRSVSMFEGYRNYPEKTAEVMHNGWYLSGDLGFEFQGQYYIIGRKKDLIISAGKNIYPEDVEEVISSVEGLTPGRLIVFGEENDTLGTELVSVIAEVTEVTKVTEEKKRAQKMAIVKACMEIDVTITNVYLVPSRWLVKSSSGKPGRSINKERIADPEENKKWRVI